MGVEVSRTEESAASLVDGVSLQVKELSVSFRSRHGAVQALDSVSLELARGEILGVVGESGCGKSTLGLAAMRLLPPAAQVSGDVLVGADSMMSASPARLTHMRGDRIGMVFQDAMTALNPSMPIGKQISEVLRAHRTVSPHEARRMAIDLLDRVGIPDAARRFNAYVHQLSGGLRQRVGIAIAVACSPSVLIADEPTTALDATIETQVLDLILTLRRDMGISVLLITHNIGVVQRVTDRVMVMYAGRKVEEGPTNKILRSPRHPYTKRLIAARPRRGSKSRLNEIPGMVPTLAEPAGFCAFAPRCHSAIDQCRTTRPELRTIDDVGAVACFVPEED